MAVFTNYLPRTKRVIFFARYEAFRERAKSITPEHLLRGLLREDPQLFTIIAPEVPDLVSKLQHDLAVLDEDPLARTRNDDIRLSLALKEIISGTEILRQRLGHDGIATQHLLLALLVGRTASRGWFGWPKLTSQDNHSRAQQLLIGYGLTASSVEAKVKEGIVTPGTWVVDEPLLKLNAQLNALAELLISKKIFRRSEFVELIDRNEGPITPEAFLLPLIDALFAKGNLNSADKESITGAPASHLCNAQDPKN